MKQYKRHFLFAALLSFLLLGAGRHFTARASDHDDGETELKGRNLNLTDLFVFREDWQDANGRSDQLVLVMNSNPRSIARQQYFFSTQARYQFHLSRIAASDKDTRPTGQEDMVLRFEFGAPDNSGNQPIQFTVLHDGQVLDSVAAGLTTSLADSNTGSRRNNNVSVAGTGVTIFAGLREDPFFFDVERFFQVRALLATGVNTLRGPTQGGANVFRSDATAVDFAQGYNVNSIVIRVPMSLLQSGLREPIFDVWETIWIKQ